MYWLAPAAIFASTASTVALVAPTEGDIIKRRIDNTANPHSVLLGLGGAAVGQKIGE